MGYLKKRMEFSRSIDLSKVLEVADPQKRRETIVKILEKENWEDHVEEICSSNGGWPEDAFIEKVEIDEDDEMLDITGVVNYTECRPSSCKDMSYSSSEWVNVEITAKREFEYRHADVEISGGSGDSDNAGDYY